VYKWVVITDPIYKHIGTLIKTRRKTLGMKQETLANMLRISRGSLANVETGRQNVLVHNLYKFAAALKLTPFDLLPPLSNDDLEVERTELPVPDDLKAQQKKQVANLFLQVDTNQKPNNDAGHVKTTKR
jgi:transcriptional regulator with XRE-family HTH domain